MFEGDISNDGLYVGPTKWDRCFSIILGYNRTKYDQIGYQTDLNFKRDFTRAWRKDDNVLTFVNEGNYSVNCSMVKIIWVTFGWSSMKTRNGPFLQSEYSIVVLDSAEVMGDLHEEGWLKLKHPEEPWVVTRGFLRDAWLSWDAKFLYWYIGEKYWLYNLLLNPWMNSDCRLNYEDRGRIRIRKLVEILLEEQAPVSKQAKDTHMILVKQKESCLEYK